MEVHRVSAICFLRPVGEHARSHRHSRGWPGPGQQTQQGSAGPRPGLLGATWSLVNHRTGPLLGRVPPLPARLPLQGQCGQPARARAQCQRGLQRSGAQGSRRAPRSRRFQKPAHQRSSAATPQGGVGRYPSEARDSGIAVPHAAVVRVGLSVIALQISAVTFARALHSSGAQGTATATCGIRLQLIHRLCGCRLGDRHHCWGIQGLGGPLSSLASTTGLPGVSQWQGPGKVQQVQCMPCIIMGR